MEVIDGGHVHWVLLAGLLGTCSLCSGYCECSGVSLFPSGWLLFRLQSVVGLQKPWVEVCHRIQAELSCFNQLRRGPETDI